MKIRLFKQENSLKVTVTRRVGLYRPTRHSY